MSDIGRQRHHGVVDIGPVLLSQLHNAHLFVAALGASSLTYAEARWSETLPDWIGAHVNAFDFIGGVPKALTIEEREMRILNMA